MSEVLTDQQIAEMLNAIKENFGEAEEEIVTENSYSFKNRTSNMIDGLEYLRGENNRTQRIYSKSMHGYDD